MLFAVTSAYAVTQSNEDKDTLYWPPVTQPPSSVTQSDTSAMSRAQKIELLSEISNKDINSAIKKVITGYSEDDLVDLLIILVDECDVRGLTDSSESVGTLQNGDSGEDVVTLQQRLIDLGYLSGATDGVFGNKTAEAVRLFQQEVGFAQTGIAGSDTQRELFSKSAPIAKTYLNLDFKAISRNPDSYTGKNYVFTGKVLQVMESDSLLGTSVSLRVATRGNYDDVVYVSYTRKEGESLILEDDRVTIHGESTGLFTYTSVLGSKISLPSFRAESITLN